MPGGTVEWGETLADALVREVQEETGFTVRPGEVLAVLDHIHPEIEEGLRRCGITATISSNTSQSEG